MIYPYREQSRVSVLPVSLSKVKEYCRIGSTVHDTLLTSLTNACRDYFEDLTNTYTTDITFKTYRAGFDCYYQIRKFPLKSISSIKYYDTDGALQTVSSSDYYIMQMDGYDLVVFKSSFSRPSLSTDNGWPIEIEFLAGYTNQSDQIPEDIATAIKAHVLYIFENRGDCEDMSSLVRKYVPITTQLTIDNYKIMEIGV